MQNNQQLWAKIVGSVFVGSLAYYTILVIFDFFMWHLAGCEALGAFDAIFLLDDEKNVSNIVGTIRFEKFEFEEMKEYLLKKTEQMHKCRSKLVKSFGIWWFKKMTEEEWEKKKEDVIVCVKDIHTEKELN